MDIFGQALEDHYQGKPFHELWLHNSYGDPEEMPVAVFFREPSDLSELEQQALSLCKGSVLDIGAGVGAHSLPLQQKGIDVTAIDVCTSAVEIMKARGIEKAFVRNIFDEIHTYDTLLLLMNGIGLTGTLPGFLNFLRVARKWLRPGGQLIFDSSDISYLYEGTMFPQDHYFGEVSFCYEYKKRKGHWFDWLYIDPQSLKQYAETSGWNCRIIHEDGYDQYLAQLIPR